SSSDDGTVRLWDGLFGAPLGTLQGPAGALPEAASPLAALVGYDVRYLAFGPDGTRLASANSNGTMDLWDARDLKLVARLEGHRGSVYHVAFSPDGTRMASASEDKTVRLWDAREGKPLATLTGHALTVQHLAFSPDGTRLASASFDKTVRLWDG